MLEAVLYAIPYGIFLSFLIGPVFFVIIETAISKGEKAALSIDLGVILSDAFFITLAYYSSKDLLEKVKENPSLFMIGGTVIFIYGLTNLIQKGKMKRSKLKVKKNNIPKLIMKGFLLNIINIGVFLFWLGVMVIIHPQLGFNSNNTITFFVVVLLTYFIIDFIKIILAKKVKKKLTLRRIIYIKQILGIILMIFGIILFLKPFLFKSDLL